ncbi:MAG: chemotaxis protein CheW, partial [Dehalococcoidales bacterium]
MATDQLTGTANTVADSETQLVVFDLAAEFYGVDIGDVREIIRMQAITRVPGAPPFVEGVINLRGR